ncbi:MAG: hypothetical protein HYZ38_27020 [Mycobacterium sp.]|nr:hypothetical protein [Mycobacterium sp.]
MKARLSTIGGLLVAAGASLAIVAAPAAVADPLLPDCTTTGSGGGGMQGGATTECATEGNTQIDATPPAYAFPWEGNYWVL